VAAVLLCLMFLLIREVGSSFVVDAVWAYYNMIVEDTEGEIRHGLFVVVHLRSSCAQIESALFAAYHLFSLCIPRVAPFVATFYHEELRSHSSG